MNAMRDAFEQTAITATLHNWSVEWGGGGFYLRGEIHHDTQGRFNDGEIIHTSSLKTVDYEFGIARTANSIYQLE